MSKNSTSNSVNMSSQLARQLVAPMSPAKTSYHHNVCVLINIEKKEISNTLTIWLD